DALTVDFAAIDEIERSSIQILIESGQYHRTVRPFRDGGEQIRHCWQRAGRSRGDNGSASTGGETLRFASEQVIAPRRRIDEAFLREVAGPALVRDVQEFNRTLPILVKFGGHQSIELIE